MNDKIIIGWWSAGITSAVACKIALELYDNVQLYYIETGKSHPDNTRLKTDCEKWYGVKIETLRNRKYQSPLDVVYKERFINGPTGAKCTKVLKKDVRENLQNILPFSNQIFGFEFDKKQINRAIRFIEQYPEANALFPLIDKGLTKNNCAALLLNAGIELPAMYKLGYNNNNCPGCLKGGRGYWNKVRVDFPEIFEETAKAERHINRSCIKGVFLDELPEGDGREPEPVTAECGIFCEVDFADLESTNLQAVLNGKLSVYDAAYKAK